MRTHLLLRENPKPSLEEIRQAIKPHLCRCTGYKKIEKAIQHTAYVLNETALLPETPESTGVGQFLPKYKAFETAIGQRPFVNDLFPKDCLYGVLHFSEHPRAIIQSIDIEDANKVPGLTKILTASDIPGKINTGLIYADWPLMISTGEITHYIGDVIACVIAESEEAAREASSKIKVHYEVLPGVYSPQEALLPNSIQVHNHHDNLLDTCRIRKGDAFAVYEKSEFKTRGDFETQRIEHAFLETESALAQPDGDGILLFSCGQGIYEDRRQISIITGLPEERIRVILVPNGGGFGGKEDLTVQGHVALGALLLQKPVKITLRREESIRMHPKRHPVWMDMKLACDKNGKLTSLVLKAIGDTGAYASVGTKVMERVAGHATAGYYVPNIELEALTVYTNNIPCGAMRGFGANQVAFAIENCIDDLCRQGGFDRWQFRYNNALVDGLETATGQKVNASGIRACLNALKPYYDKSKFKGLSCAIKNSGIGNGMVDFSDVIIEIGNDGFIYLKHGWTEMGQGVDTIAIQILCNETGIIPSLVKVETDTEAGIKTGMTTSSRATVLLGNAILEACCELRKDLENHSLKDLAGKKYHAKWICDWTTKPGANVKEHITHYSYGYAAQLVVLNDDGQIETIYAAHDAGKIMNPVFFEGQIEGAIHMGVGYALTEDLPMKEGRLISHKLRDCGVLRAHETPDIVVIPVEVPDPVGPYGAKGIGEIGLIPTAAAISTAMAQYHGKIFYKLPLKTDHVTS
jgi:selenium-dependent xanthine dehydrogenase